MRVLKHPLAQFLAGATLVLVGVVMVTGRLSSAAAEKEAIADALATTEVLAQSVAEPGLPPGLVGGDAGAIDRFDRLAEARLRVNDVHRIKIWNDEGTIVYSDLTRLIQQTFALGEEEISVLRQGETDADYLALSRGDIEPENKFELGEDGLLEVYTRITSPEGEPLLFEVYYSAERLDARQDEIFGAFRPITLTGLGVMILFASPLIWGLTTRLRKAAEERERLLTAAVHASDAERRRIARDLHDGVVQDLAGTAFHLAALGQDPRESPEARVRLQQMNTSLRAGLRSLRSLLVEIYPPDLGVDGLPAALNDLLAPLEGAGVTTTAEVEAIPEMPADDLALVWRVAQEAVRNAARHARPSRVAVWVAALNGSVVLEVADDGAGFDLARQPRGDSLGLRGLRDLVTEAGGRLTVASRPGQGTTVRLAVPR